jgi:hypothetical protein
MWMARRSDRLMRTMLRDTIPVVVLAALMIIWYLL